MDDHEALDVYQQCLGELLLVLAGRQAYFLPLKKSLYTIILFNPLVKGTSAVKFVIEEEI